MRIFGQRSVPPPPSPFAQENKAWRVANMWKHHASIPYTPPPVDFEIRGLNLRVIDQCLAHAIESFLTNGPSSETPLDVSSRQSLRNLRRVRDGLPRAVQPHFHSLDEIASLVVIGSHDDIVDPHLLAHVVRAAFPAALADEAAVVANVIPPTSTLWSNSGTRVLVGDDHVEIPGRIHTAEPSDHVWESLSPRQRILASCLYTRHSNGWVRERHVRRIVSSNEPWVPPYVLGLLEECVVEIDQAIADDVDGIPREPHVIFAAANPEFMRLVRQRSLNYWATYYRSAPFVDYPSYRVLKSLGLWKGPLPRRWPRHTPPQR